MLTTNLVENCLSLKSGRSYQYCKKLERDNRREKKMSKVNLDIASMAKVWERTAELETAKATGTLSSAHEKLLERPQRLSALQDEGLGIAEEFVPIVKSQVLPLLLKELGGMTS